MPKAQGTPRGELLAINQQYPLNHFDRWIAPLVSPVTPVSRDEYHYDVVPRKTMLQNVPGGGIKRGNGQPAKRLSGAMIRQGGTCERSTIEWPVDVEQESTPEEQLAAERAAAEVVARSIKLENEMEVAGNLFNPTNYPDGTRGTTVGTAWTAAGGTPISDINAVRDNGLNSTGIPPNTLIMDEKTYLGLRSNTQFLEAYGDNHMGRNAAGALPGIFDTSAVASVFQLDQVLVPHLTIDTTDLPTDITAGQIWTGGYAFLCYVNPTPDVSATTVHRTFVNTNKSGFISLDEYMEDGITSRVMRAQANRDNDFVDRELGFLFQGVAA
ncbi:MAG: hypothetical protein AAGF47_03735 [Planctomycetota bacterium]